MDGWAALAALRRGRERWAFEQRVLGGGALVERLLREGEVRPRVAIGVSARRALPLFTRGWRMRSG